MQVTTAIIVKFNEKLRKYKLDKHYLSKSHFFTVGNLLQI